MEPQLIRLRAQLRNVNSRLATCRAALATIWFLSAISPELSAQELEPVGRHIIEVASSIDGSLQPNYLILPDDLDNRDDKVPIVVSLHSWSFGFQQRRPGLEAGVTKRGWIYLFPDFRGRNDKIEACASDIAKQDVIDALDWVISRYPVDQNRIYVTGISGGGFMTLAMVATYPDRWSAASAWVPLSDLRAWHDYHAGDPYGEMTRRCVGGNPGDDPSIAAEMDRRSPLYGLAAAKDVPVDIAAGSYDGHNGAPIPIWHSLAAFNVIAEAVVGQKVTADEIEQLSRHEPRLDTPKESDKVVDPTFGRQILLRRYAHNSRVTIFEGGHEGLPDAALAWFDTH
jgi:poly(3-hydroxybutyrate) depolymerase